MWLKVLEKSVSTTEVKLCCVVCNVIKSRWLVPTSISHGQSLHNQSWVRQLTFRWVPRICGAEVQAAGKGVVVWGEGMTERRAPAWGLIFRQHRLGPSCECKVRGLFGLACGRRTVPLPCLNLSPITPISTSPLSQGASDSVSDVSWCGQIACWGGKGDRGSQAACLGSCRARQTHPFALLLHALFVPLPFVSVEGPFL